MLLLVNVVSYLLFPIRLTLLFTFSSLKLCNSVSDILLLQHFILWGDDWLSVLVLCDLFKFNIWRVLYEKRDSVFANSLLFPKLLMWVDLFAEETWLSSSTVQKFYYFSFIMSHFYLHFAEDIIYLC